MPKKVDLTGKRFGRLVVEKETRQRKNGQVVWKCKCDCGDVVCVSTGKLKSGNTKSCGCYKRDMSAQRLRTHGKKGTNIYKVWCGIKSRCYNRNHEYYYLYGGRGIKMCDEWLTFEGFYEDMGSTYQKGLSIDRINNNGNYFKENCRWVTPREQGNNKRNNRLFFVDGNKDTLSNLCKKYNMKYGTVKGRLSYGWDIDKALKTEVLR